MRLEKLQHMDRVRYEVLDVDMHWNRINIGFEQEVKCI